MNKPITMEDLAAFTRTELEILSLPSTAEQSDYEPVEQSEEYQQARYQTECDPDNPGALVVSHCEGEKRFCLTHGRRFFLFMHMQEAHLRPGESPRPCPNGCGRPQIECWSPVHVDERLLKGNPHE